MTAYVTDAGQVRWTLPNPIAWRLEYTAGVPCDSFWLRCVWDENNTTKPEEWVSFTAEHEGQRVFVNANLKLSIFAETKCHFSAVGTVVHTALFNNPTWRYEACQALIYQLVLGLTGENGKYNYSKAVHVYPPFSDIPCSAKNYKIAPALTCSPAWWTSAR